MQALLFGTADYRTLVSVDPWSDLGCKYIQCSKKLFQSRCRAEADQTNIEIANSCHATATRILFTGSKKRMSQTKERKLSSILIPRSKSKGRVHCKHKEFAVG
ncbi:unnamed protein product [Cercospora beticola]|nr:unnamed protein product [Cercospora beticola]